MKQILFITSLLFFNFSFSSCTNDSKAVENEVVKYKSDIHKLVYTSSGEQRLELIMDAYRNINKVENRGEVVTEIRANRYNVANNYPQTGKDVYEEGLKNWYENYPDEVAEYIIYLNSFTK